MTKNFYDKIVRKFGKDVPEAKHIMDYPEGDPESVFEQKLPTPYRECQRIIKPRGYFLTIGIGEKDTWELKQIFGRGQGYGVWNTPVLEQAEEQLCQEGFEAIYGQNFLFDEYHASYHDLDLFLQEVPIFEDFDSEKDRKLLETYVATSQTEKGIRLPRHRIVIVAMKL